MNRLDFQRLAIERLADAKILLASKRWTAAYYLSGYAVECGLKSCILARLQTAPELIFNDRKLSDRCWTHNLLQLQEIAGLKADMDAAGRIDPMLRVNWDLAKDWNESSRYARVSKSDAEALFEAVADKKHGVLSWIKARW